MNIEPTMKFLIVARLCEVDRDAPCSHDWFPYEYMTGKLSRASGSASMVCKLADGTEEKPPVQKRCILFTVKSLLRAVCRSALLNRLECSA